MGLLLKSVTVKPRGLVDGNTTGIWDIYRVLGGLLKEIKGEMYGSIFNV